MLFSIRGDDGLTSFGGDVRFDRPVTFLDDVTHRGKLVIMDGQDGGSSRGLYLFNIDDTNWGLYMASSGTGQSLADGTAVTGRDFTGLSARLRLQDNANRGFVIENGSESRLFSVRGSDGLAFFRGSVIHNGKIVVQDGQNGGAGRGIHLWTLDDTRYGIYMGGSSSAPLSGVENTTAVSGYGYMTGLSVRFRTRDSDTGGFIFENSSEKHLMSVRGSDGRVNFSVNVVHHGKIVVQDGQDGGSSRGIYLSTAGDARFGIYIASSGPDKSLSDGTAVPGARFSDMSVRFRVAYPVPNQTPGDGELTEDIIGGFLFENSAEIRLVSIRASDGETDINGNLVVNGQTIITGDAIVNGDVQVDGVVQYKKNGIMTRSVQETQVLRTEAVRNFQVDTTASTAEFYIGHWNQSNTVGDHLLLEIEYSVSTFDIVDADVNVGASNLSRKGMVRISINTMSNENSSAGRNETYHVIDYVYDEAFVNSSFTTFNWTLRHTGDDPGQRIISLFVDVSGGIASVQASFVTKLTYAGQSIAFDYDPVPDTSDTGVGYRTGEGGSVDLDGDGTATWSIAPVRKAAWRIRDAFIGLGTTFPQHQLDVVENNRDAEIRLKSDDYAGLRLVADSDTNNPRNAFIKMSVAGGNASSVLTCVKTSNTAGERGAGTYNGTNALSTLLGTTSSHDLHLGTDNQVRFTIDNVGHVGIGTPPSQSYFLDVQGTVNAPAFRGDGNAITNLEMDNAGTGVLNVNRGGTGTGSLTASRLLVANSSDGSSVQTPSDLFWNFSNNRLGIGNTNPTSKLYVQGNIRASEDIVAESDARIKTDLRPVKDAIEKVAGLTGYTFSRTDLGENRSTERFMGLLAQDVREVAPEAVQYDQENDLYAVAYGNLSALFVEALKQLHQTNMQLRLTQERLQSQQDDHSKSIAELRTLRDTTDGLAR
jgi:hypothetical protein